MNTQEIFDKVSNHLLTQGVRSQRPDSDSANPSCLYRGPNGTSCAVGCLITDKVYEKVGKFIEGAGVTDDNVADALEMSGIHLDADTLNLLRALQVLHDTAAPAVWKEQLHRVAAEHGLQVNFE